MAPSLARSAVPSPTIDCARGTPAASQSASTTVLSSKNCHAGCLAPIRRRAPECGGSSGSGRRSAAVLSGSKASAGPASQPEPSSPLMAWCCHERWSEAPRRGRRRAAGGASSRARARHRVGPSRSCQAAASSARPQTTRTLPEGSSRLIGRPRLVIGIAAMAGPLGAGSDSRGSRGPPYRCPVRGGGGWCGGVGRGGCRRIRR